MDVIVNEIPNFIYGIAGYIAIVVALGLTGNDEGGVTRIIALLMATLLFYQVVRDKPNYLFYQTPSKQVYGLVYEVSGQEIQRYAYKFDGTGRRFKNCVIKDSENWACGHLGGNPSIAMIDGEIPEEYIYKSTQKPVSYWKYLRVKWFGE